MYTDAEEFAMTLTPREVEQIETALNQPPQINYDLVRVLQSA